RLFVIPVIDHLLGLPTDRLHPSVTAMLTTNLPSQAGQEDWIAIRLVNSPQGRMAEPIFGKSNLIFNLCEANGLLRIPANSTGMSAGDAVEVLLQ
ncbi:MAG: molybdopterin molybdenumtransferase MoeA, partial [Anaerolineales bacterium]|nr:molybdopterin molybdenumtransferase MoeA [Anaerolineales bacterium]